MPQESRVGGRAVGEMPRCIHEIGGPKIRNRNRAASKPDGCSAGRRVSQGCRHCILQAYNPYPLRIDEIHDMPLAINRGSLAVN